MFRKRQKLLPGHNISIDEVLEVALAKIYPEKTVEQILGLRPELFPVLISPKGVITERFNGSLIGIRAGSVWISATAYRKQNDPSQEWVGMPMVPQNWKLSLLFLLIARDLKQPGCYHFSIPIAKKLWSEHKHDHEA